MKTLLLTLVLAANAIAAPTSQPASTSSELEELRQQVAALTAELASARAELAALKGQAATTQPASAPASDSSRFSGQVKITEVRPLTSGNAVVAGDVERKSLEGLPVKLSEQSYARYQVRFSMPADKAPAPGAAVLVSGKPGKATRQIENHTQSVPVRSASMSTHITVTTREVITVMLTDAQIGTK